MQNKANFMLFSPENDDSTKKQTQFKAKTNPIKAKTNPIKAKTKPIEANFKSKMLADLIELLEAIGRMVKVYLRKAILER